GARRPAADSHPRHRFSRGAGHAAVYKYPLFRPNEIHMRAERRHVGRHEALGRARLASGSLALGALAACGGVAIKPDPALPRPLLQPLPASVALVLPHESRNYL